MMEKPVVPTEFIGATCPSTAAFRLQKRVLNSVNQYSEGVNVSSYFIARIKIHDPKEYEKYLKGFDGVFSDYDGEMLVVDDNPELLEGEWAHSRIVVIRFPTKEEAKRWYESAEYQELAQHRFTASKADTVLAKGRD